MEPAGVTAAFNFVATQLHAIMLAVQTLRDVQTELQTGQNELRRLVMGHAQSQASPVPVLVPNPGPEAREPGSGVSQPAPEPRVSMPDRFDGDRSTYRTFVTACEVLFALLPHTYHSDFIRIRTVISLLTGEPQLWAHQLLLSSSPVLRSWDSFLAAMNIIYDDPFKAASSHTALRDLRQGKRDIEPYVSDFRRLSLSSTWNESALLDHFRQGLSEAVKDELVRCDYPDTLEKAMSLCIKIDRRLRERRREKAHQGGPPVSHTPKNRAGVPRPTASPGRFPPASLRLQTPALEEEEEMECGSNPDPQLEDEPMQIGATRGPLSEAERRRRLTTGRCLYCGGPGHILMNCTLRPRNPGCKTGACASSRAQDQEPPHLTIPVLLRWGRSSVALEALVDSGAGGNLIDRALVLSKAIPVRPKAFPVTLQTVDGSPMKSGPVTQETRPLHMALSKDHDETITLDVVASPLFPVVLGLPWLRRHNPSVDWSRGLLAFPSRFCGSHCLHPDKPSVDVPPRRGHPSTALSAGPSQTASSAMDLPDLSWGLRFPLPRPPKRPRGRPRKYPIMQSPSVPGSQTSLSPSAPASQTPAPEAPRRPRGRPRKHPLRDPSVPPPLPSVGDSPSVLGGPPCQASQGSRASSDLDLPSVFDIPADPGAPKPPGPRGRPRKHPVVVTARTPSPSLDGVAADRPRRGHPRKPPEGGLAP